MPGLHHVEGDATQPLGTRPAVVAHIVNRGGIWGKDPRAGFVYAVGRRWPEAERVCREMDAAYRDRGEYIPLGQTQLIAVEEGDRPVWVANMVAQLAPGEAWPPIRYDALTRCLRELAGIALRLGADVHMPRIGTGLAGGDWAEIEGIIQRNLASLATVFVYTLPPR